MVFTTEGNKMYIKSVWAKQLLLIYIYQNISQIIKGDYKKTTQIKQHHQLECNCGVKTECHLMATVGKKM